MLVYDNKGHVQFRYKGKYIYPALAGAYKLVFIKHNKFSRIFILKLNNEALTQRFH